MYSNANVKIEYQHIPILNNLRYYHSHARALISTVWHIYIRLSINLLLKFIFITLRYEFKFRRIRLTVVQKSLRLLQFHLFIFAFFLRARCKMWIILLVTLLTIWFLYSKWKYSYWSSRDVPNPKPFLFCGNFASTFLFRKALGEVITEWYK